MLKAWLRDPADYCWQVHTLASHSALDGVKLVVAGGGAVMAVIGFLMTISQSGPRGVFGTTVVWLSIAYAIFWALRWWLLPWPSVRESLMLFAAADVSITAEVMQNADHSYGVTGLILLMVTGGYLTFFHSARILALHAGWSLLAVLLLAVLMVLQGADIPLAAAEVLIMLSTTVVVLPTLQFVYWVLRTETMSDPLTKLFNRRGLEYRLAKMLEDKGPGVCVISVDLDRFKKVNDTFGHRIGDEVLIRTAQRLRAAADPGAVVARVGGEEFVVIERITVAGACVEAERLREAVAETGEPAISITASIGVAAFDTSPVCTPSRFTPDFLMQCADSAMYEAKRCGGNLVVLGGFPGNGTGPVPQGETGPVHQHNPIRKPLRPAP